MTAINRLWIAFAAIGAGTIHLAVGASASVLLAVIFAGLGIAELGWGVATLVRGRFPFADQAPFAFLIPVAVWITTAALGSAFGLTSDATGVPTLPTLPMAIATLFSLFVAGTLAIARRRATGTCGSAAAPAQQGWRFLAALMLGGLLVSGLTTPALAATDAGRQAVPHGSHSDFGPVEPPVQPDSHH